MNRLLHSFRNAVYIHGVGDGVLYQGNKLPKFPHKALIISEWNKNAVYANLTPGRFPFLQKIMILPHPCARGVWNRFPNAHWYSVDGKFFSENKSLKHTVIDMDQAAAVIQHAEQLDSFTAEMDDHFNKVWHLMQTNPPQKK